MPMPIRTALFFLVATPRLGHAPPSPGGSDTPAPGTPGNPDNAPYIPPPAPNAHPVPLAKATGHVSNYSEERLRPYTLPDPLVMANGARVTGADQWFKARRPEILKLYRDEIYGHVPDGAPEVTWEVVETDTAARDGAAV